MWAFENTETAEDASAVEMNIRNTPHREALFPLRSHPFEVSALCLVQCLRLLRL
jgi:hypothetical protein